MFECVVAHCMHIAIGLSKNLYRQPMWTLINTFKSKTTAATKLCGTQVYFDVFMDLIRI